MTFPNLKKLVISAPFGLYFQYPFATSTIGTYTLQNRGGPLYRLWRCLLTLRYRPGLGAWTNRLGLPNPGIRSLPESGDYREKILSIYGFSREEWKELAKQAAIRRPLAVELNLSCPNVSHPALVRDFVQEASAAVDLLLACGVPVIAKLPPIRPDDYATPMFNAGVRIFHACNTMPCPAGGMSGKPLKQLSLWAIAEMRRWWGHNDIRVIGGGGVTSAEDVLDYLDAGADHVAVGSALLNPFFWGKVRCLARVASMYPGKEAFK